MWAALICIAGCSRTETTNGKVRLTLACWEGPEGLASLEQLLDVYQKHHPNVSVEIQQVAGAQYYQRLKIQFAAGVAPDIMQLAYDQLPAFADRNTLQPLNGLIRRDHFPVGGMFKELIPALKYKGKYYGLPRGWTTFVLYYNKDMFRAAGLPFPRAGWTWDDFLTACRKTTKDTDGDGRIDTFGCNAPTQSDGLSLWIWQNGGRLFSPDMKRCLLDQPADVQAVQFLADCEYRYHVFPTPDQSADMGGGGEMFRSGRQAMFIDGRWACQSFRGATYADGRPIHWDVAPPPMAKARATVLFANCYVLRKNGPNLQAAWDLMKWLTGYAGQRHQSLTGRDMPSFVKIAQSSDFMDPVHPPEHDRVFLDVAEYARPLEVDANSGETEDLIARELQQIFTAHRDVKRGLSELRTKINAVQSALYGTAGGER